MKSKHSFLLPNRLIIWILLASVFISSFLSFSIQPILVKFLLPTFGGTSTVWVISSTVFQILLLIGYSYSHFFLKKQNKPLIILAFTCLAGLIVSLFLKSPNSPPFIIDPNIFPITQPFLLLPIYLIVSIGLPYIALTAATTIIQQHWFKITNKSNPYWIYRLSNTGSILGLLSYPFLIEPYTALSVQTWSWFSFLGLLTLFFLIIIFVDSTPNNNKPALPMKSEPISRSIKLQWLTHALIPTFVLTTITTYITKSIAPGPLLWVLPLSLYLISFIITFKTEFRIRIRYILLQIILGLAIFAFYLTPDFSLIIITLPITLSAAFLTFLFEHSKAYQKRPTANQLTNFYFYLTLGGLIGSFLASIIPPLIFKDYLEIPIALTIIIISAAFTLKSQYHQYKNLKIQSWIPIEPIIITALILGSYSLFSTIFKNNFYQNRNFYSTLRIIDKNNQRLLYNGSILHGSQYLSQDKQLIPTTYYGPPSGGYQAYLTQRLNKSNLDIGVIGLGTGVLSTLCQPQDKFFFWEINPQVIEVANKYFTYLKNCPQVKIIQGDARIKLTEFDQQLDILYLDAFTDDAIPNHLLTKEAFGLYLKHLKPTGTIAVHISNRYLNLNPLIYGISDHFNLNAQTIYVNTFNGDYTPSHYVLLNRQNQFLPEPTEYTITRPNNLKTILWTDDYSPITPLLRLL